MIEIGNNFTNSLKSLRKDLRRRQSQETIENRIWTLFKTLGFEYLNVDGECLVKYGGGQELFSTQKIDVIAESNDLRIFVECTTQRTNTQKIKSWTSEVKQIRKFHGKEEISEKKNIIFAYGSNTRLNQTDHDLLRENGVSYLNDSICDYFFKLAKQYKKLGYYQFVGYLCKNKPIKNLDRKLLKVPAIKTKYGSKNDCYLFGVHPSTLIPLSAVPHRKKDFSELPDLNYQRIIKKTKISGIKKFITEKRGVFPTNIILSIDQKVKFERQKTIGNIQHGIIHLPDKYQCISVIDGQHRLFAYDGLSEADKDLIFVIAFEKMDLEEQVKTFIDVNENQTKVSPSLLWDLYPSILGEEDMKTTIALLGKRLNEDPSSTLQGYIEYDSADYSNKKPKFTLESVCTSIKNEKIIELCESYSPIEESNSNKDEFPFVIISAWYDVISKLDEDHWNRKERTMNFYRSNQAFGAFSKLLKGIIEEEHNVLFTLEENEIRAKLREYVTPIINKVKTIVEKEDIKAFKRIGEGGKQQLFQDLVELVQQNKPSFCEDLVTDDKDVVNRYIKSLKENAEGTDIEVKEAYFTDTKRLKATGEHHNNARETLDKILHSIIGFANSSNGGTLLIGIEDKTWEVVGLEHTDLKNVDLDKLKHKLDQEFERIKGLNRLPVVKRLFYGNRSILEIKVPSLPKERFRHTQLVSINGDCYKRSNSSAVKINASEIGNYCGFVLENWEN